MPGKPSELSSLIALEGAIRDYHAKARRDAMAEWEAWQDQRRLRPFVPDPGPPPKSDAPYSKVSFFFEQFEVIRLKLQAAYPDTLGRLPSPLLPADQQTVMLDKIGDLHQAIRYCISALGAPDLAPTTEPDGTASAALLVVPGTVFVIFGHDEANAHRLQAHLRDEWGLRPVLLDQLPGRGRTIIEKFEQEAAPAEYAVALLTSDDLVVKGEEDYRQARPNVLFEVGYFCGRLQRKKVCLIVGQEVQIPSDLNGVQSLRFKKSVDDIFIGLQRELRGAGLLDSPTAE